jgi:ADP-ribose pyrophosphatase YjhB (NUDIX family)
MNNPYYYVGANPTVDLIILSPEGKILLAQRVDDSPACPGMWALPGGFVNTVAKKGEPWKAGSETPETAATREVEEETNLVLENVVIYPVGVYEGNHRDPRDNDISWSKSHAFFHAIDQQVFNEQKDNLVGKDDVKKVDWFTIEEVLAMELAFDHKKIIVDALIQHNLLPEGYTQDSGKNKMKP